MIRRPPRSTLSSSSAASDVYKRQRLDDPGDGQVERVGGFPSLEEDVGILGRAAHDRRLRGHAPVAECQDVLIADEGLDVLLLEHCDLVDLVRCPEAIEEVQERYASPERGGMGDQGEVVS